MANGQIKINELPKATLVNDDDVFILENDIVTQQLSLSGLVNFIKEHPEVSGCYARQTAVEELSDNLSSHRSSESNPHSVTKEQVGLSNVDNTSDMSKPVSTPQQSFIDNAYANSNAYTDQKIADLINGAPSTLDTLGKIANALKNNSGVSEALDEAIGSKADAAELDSHTHNDTIHITASERTGWNNKLDKTGDASNTVAKFSQAASLENISNGEKISTIMAKVSKAIVTLISHISAKATSGVSGHVKLSDTYKNAVTGGAAADGMGASQKALADAYCALNSNLGNCTFSVDADGAYVTYIPEGGADAVTKKLGSDTPELVQFPYIAPDDGVAVGFCVCFAKSNVYPVLTSTIAIRDMTTGTDHVISTSSTQGNITTNLVPGYNVFDIKKGHEYDLLTIQNPPYGKFGYLYVIK